MSKQSKIIKQVVKTNVGDKSTFGTDPREPWSVRYGLNETALLNRYLKSRGINPDFATKDQKVAHSKTTQFKTWMMHHVNDNVVESMSTEPSPTRKRLNALKHSERKQQEMRVDGHQKLHTEAVDKKDTITFDIPLLIRVLEFAREDLKSDINLHKMVERLLTIRGKGTLTMNEYGTIVKEELEQLEESSLQTLNSYMESKEANYGGDYQSSVLAVKAKAEKKPVDMKSLAARMQASYRRENQSGEVKPVKEDISRRGVLKGILGAAGVGAAGKASAIAGAFPSPSTRAKWAKDAEESNRNEAKRQAEKKKKELEDNTKEVERQQKINHHSLANEEVNKKSIIGKIVRGHQLKKKVDSSFEKIGAAQKQGDSAGASKAFRDHERYANLERPGTWTKVKEETVTEGYWVHRDGDTKLHFNTVSQLRQSKVAKSNHKVTDHKHKDLGTVADVLRNQTLYKTEETLDETWKYHTYPDNTVARAAVKAHHEFRDEKGMASGNPARAMGNGKVAYKGDFKGPKPQKQVVEGNGYDDNRTGFAKKPREDDEGHPKPKFKAKDIMDRPHTVHIDGKPWKKFSSGHQAHAAVNTLTAKGKKAVAIAHFKESLEPMAACNCPSDGANTPDDTKPSTAKKVKLLLGGKKGMVKEDLYDKEKDDKPSAGFKNPKVQKLGVDPQTKETPQAAAVLTGGKTLTGEPRDTIEIDPMMKTKKPSPSDTQKGV